MQLKYLAGVLLLVSIVSCSPGGKKMAAIMDDIRRQNDDRDNPFSSAAKLAFVDSMISTASSNNHKMQMEYFKANVLLQAGDEKQAFSILDRMLGQFHLTDIRVYQEIIKSYGIAALRLGERQNCVLSHSTESCIMPVKGMGIHHDQFGSSKAINAYLQLLKINPGDLESRWLLNIAYMTLGQYLL